MSMFDSLNTSPEETFPEADSSPAEPGLAYLAVKRAFDLVVSIVLLLPFLIVFGPVLMVANRFGNAGPLIFRQKRMGQNGAPFWAYKFRTMSEDGSETRGADDGLEVHRITWLGRILRKIRIDELPQIINVLRGEMSLIGPQPDMYEHALHYMRGEFRGEVRHRRRI